MAKILLIVLLVIVALVLVRVMFLRRGDDRARPVSQVPARPAVDAGPLELEVIRLLESGKKIQAVRVVRKHTGLGLKEAKDLVDEVERTGRLVLPVWRPARPVAGDVIDEARRLKAAGRAIDAVRLIRQRTGMGLKEAKDTYDRL